MSYIKKTREHYNIYLQKTSSFKTISISFVFQRLNTQTDKLYQAMLRKMLYLKTTKYKNLEELTKAAAYIYNPVTFFNTKTSSKYRTFTLAAEFANEKYTEKGMNKKNIEFIMDYFWHPYVKDNSFDEELFKVCQKNYIEELKSIKNYPESYSLNECWRLLNLYDFKDLKTEKLIEEVEKMTAKTLYEYYKSMFTEDSLDIFILGNVNEEIIDIIDNYIYGDFKPSKMIKPKKNKEVKMQEIKEVTDSPQSKLYLGYKVIDPTTYEEKYISLMFSMILGGGTESCLHQEVREKRSLCYYIYATSYNLFNLILITSGIDKSNSNEVINIIKDEIAKIQKGLFAESRVEEVKKLYENILLEAKDSPDSLINSLINEVMRGADSPAEKFKIVKKITKEDIVTFAKKIKLDTIYLLEGR